MEKQIWKALFLLRQKEGFPYLYTESRVVEAGMI